MPPTVSEVLAVCGATRDDYKNWARRDLLKSRVVETTQGVPRPITRRAALEVAFIAALTDVGVDVAAAAEIAQQYVMLEAKDKLPAWLIHDPVTGAFQPCSEQGAMTSISTMLRLFGDDEGELVANNGSPAWNEPAHGTRFSVIHLAGVVKRIEALFAGEK
jgi:hypothetical protein